MIARWRDAGVDEEQIASRLERSGYPSHKVVPRILRLLDEKPDFRVDGDTSLTEKAEQDYPRDVSVNCLRYDLPGWAMRVTRVWGWVESGLVSINDIGAWDLDATEIAAAESARLMRERREDG